MGARSVRFAVGRVRMRPGRVVRTVAGVLTVALAVLALGEQPAIAKEPPTPRSLSAQPTESVRARQVKAMGRPADLSQGASTPAAKQVGWPSAGTAEVNLVPQSAAIAVPGLAATGSRAGTLPVTAAPATGTARAIGAAVSRVRVGVVDRAITSPAWPDGVAVRLTRADGVSTQGAVTVSVDYSSFADAYGADWSSRLRLVSTTECGLRTPGAAGCPTTVVPSRNDTSTHRVSAEVTLSPQRGPVFSTMAPAPAKVPAGSTGIWLILTAGASGSAGDFGASSLQPSATWSAGGNSGDFSWSYGMRTPPSLGGPAPAVSLSYSSSSVDGRSETTNNQPSWVGEGFEYWPGFITRSHKPCSSDMDGGANNSTATGDQCWGTDNANLSMNGRGGELIKDGTTGTWRLKNDDASRIEHLTGGVNGDNDGEYWRLTTSDGTQYYFGLNRLPGYTGTAPANKTTSSTWTVPVAGNHTGEPCHQSSFTSSFCDQAWRWNLDYVVDPHGNSMSVFYATETNKYAKNNTDTNVASYIRGGRVDHIDYGTDNRSAGVDTENTNTAAPMRVELVAADRCLTNCWSGQNANAANWSDTPWDQYCAPAASSCPGLYSPTFWTTYRLQTVTTKVWDAAAVPAAYKGVDSWSFTHTFPDPGDGTRAGLWLESIVHNGVATGGAVTGGNLTMPEINFDWVQMANRVDTITDGKPAMNWMRISTIWSETGGKLDVRYTAVDCVAPSNLPASPQTNTLRCYPVLEEQPDHSIRTEYFHKYLVTSVTDSDRTGGGPDVVTSYEYVGSPAWRHADDDGLTKDNLRTWSEFRGYGQVNTRVGDPGMGQETLTASVFFRGMHGDLNGSGGTRTVTLAAIDGNGDGDTVDTADAPAINDENAFAGKVRQSTVYNGVDTAPVTRTFSQPWQSTPTATRVIGQTTTYARYVGSEKDWSAAKMTTGWRVVRSDASFDSYGMVTQTNDFGDVAVSGDEQCTTTAYNRNTTNNMVAAPQQLDTYALPCGTSPTSDTQVIGMTRTYYDQQTLTTPPIKGDVSKVEIAKSWSQGAGAVWLTSSTSLFDAYGRPTDVADVRGNHTTMSFTPATGGPVTASSTTSQLGTTTETVEPAWGVTTATVDINNKRTDIVYDALGRVAKVWLPNRSKTTNPTSPNMQYSYLLRATGGVNAITTSKLNAMNNYVTSYALFDGLLRQRQTQSMSMANGHVGTVFAEIKYDQFGRAVSESQYFDGAVSPSTTLFTILDWQPKSQTVTEFDRAGRRTATVLKSSGAEKWRTSFAYTGNRLNVTPPVGGTATTTISDAQGRTIELRRYHNPADVGSDTRSLYDLATYHYNAKGLPDSLTDNAGTSWTQTYDFMGHRTGASDPDTGSSSFTYNDYGDVLTSTDARNQTLAYTYDSLGRKTGLYTPTTAGTKLATWAWDAVNAKGRLSSSSRWAGTDEYKVKIMGYTPLYQPVGEQYTIPASQTGLAGTYSFSRSYKVDGSPATFGFANAASLGGEGLTYTYDSVSGLPEQLQTTMPGLGQYVSNTDYTAYGEMSFVQYNTFTNNYVQRSFTYDDATRQLKDALTIRQLTPQAVDYTQYQYNNAGDLTKIASTPASGAADVQCFEHDWAQRLTEAWTPSSGDCTQAKSAAALGGPAPYWQSWTFDAVGNRATQTTHATAGDTTATSYYTVPGHTHAVDHVTTVGPGVNRTDNYGYDAIGNTTSRPGVAAGQTLTWDAEGRPATTVESGVTSSYLYTADGQRLLMNDGTSTTLYLSNMEIKRNNSTGAIVGTRYYPWAGQVCAMVTTGSPVTFLVGDHQGTQQIAITNGTQVISRRYQNPYGAARGTPPAWPNQKGFVGGDNDPTGLVNIGAREYDANLGRFISVDPVFDAADPQSWQAYGYANFSPVSNSDPTGLMRERPDGGGSCDAQCVANAEAEVSQMMLDDAINRKAEAEKVKNKSVTDLIIEAGVGFLLDFFGITDIWNCVSKGDIGACASALIGMLPWGKVFKFAKSLIKGIDKAFTAYKAWRTAVNLADKVLARADEAIAFARKKFDDAMEKLNTRKAAGGADEVAGACHSFAPDTKVLMADGTAKAIKDIEIGDEVTATDPATGETTAEPVTALHINQDHDLVDVTVQVIDSPAGVRTGRGEGDRSTRGPTQVILKTTAHHPFWDQTTQTWTNAADLTPGESTLHTTTGQHVLVTAVTEYNGNGQMRDLTVDRIHTYYVIADDAPVLVHNNNGTCPIPGHDGQTVDLHDAPGGCTCRKSVNLDRSPGSGSGQPRNAVVGQAEEIKDLRAQNESSVRALGKIADDVAESGDPTLGVALGAAYAVEKTKTWLGRLRDWWNRTWSR